MVFRGRHPRIQPLSALPNVLQIYAWFLLNSHFMEPAVHTSCYICFLVSKGHWPTFVDTNWTGQKWMIHDTIWYRIFNEVFHFFGLAHRNASKPGEAKPRKLMRPVLNPHGFYPAAATQQLGHRPGNVGLGWSGSWVNGRDEFSPPKKYWCHLEVT